MEKLISDKQRAKHVYPLLEMINNKIKRLNDEKKISLEIRNFNTGESPSYHKNQIKRLGSSPVINKRLIPVWKEPIRSSVDTVTGGGGGYSVIRCGLQIKWDLF